MPTILITLKGPMQSWGDACDYANRTTRPRPTKSGVIGLIAGMLGRERGSDISDLAAMRFGVNVIKPGRLMADYQTMGKRADGKPNPIEHKLYIADGEFIAGLETDDAQLAAQIINAARHPVYAPFLGRRSCPPAGPIFITVSEQPLDTALGEGPLYLETTETAGHIVWDQPDVGRQFRSRHEIHRNTDTPIVSASEIFNSIEAQLQ